MIVSGEVPISVEGQMMITEYNWPHDASGGADERTNRSERKRDPLAPKAGGEAKTPAQPQQGDDSTTSGQQQQGTPSQITDRASI